MSDVERSYRIEGRVQGVGFRMWTREQAQTLDLRGWVRNRRDGSVEVHVAGPEDTLRQLRPRLERGPPAAHVRRVAESEGASGLPESGFEIRH